MFPIQKSMVVEWQVEFPYKHWGRGQRFEHWCIEWGKHLRVVHYFVKWTKAKGEEGKNGVTIIDIGHKCWKLCNTKDVKEGKEGEEWNSKKKKNGWWCCET
jgi:hypothetical protein